MREIRARRVAASIIAEIVIMNEPVVLYAGKLDGVRVIALSIRGYKDKIERVYDGVEPIRVGREGLAEATLLEINMNQVDENWQPSAYGIVTVGDVDGLYLVPDNAFWRALVERTEGGNGSS